MRKHYSSAVFEYNIAMTKLEQFQGCLVGGAIGDALGAPVEFFNLDAIKQKYGESGITSYDYAYGKNGAITDDTQMTMFTTDALCQFFASGMSIPLEIQLTQAYLYWLETQESKYKDSSIKLLSHKELWSKRAPGNTCLSSLRQFKQSGTVINNLSKGCGGVMRVAPIGLAIKDPDESYCAGKMSALITHQHVDGFIPAGALARIISLIVHHGKSIQDAQEDCFDFVKKEESSCNTLQLWAKMQEYNSLDSGFNQEHFVSLGEGWTGDEAFVMSLYCALKEQNVLESIIKSVNHGGDSDSTGSITGQIAGASQGVKSLPVLFIEQLELCDVIMEQAQDLHELSQQWN